MIILFHIGRGGGDAIKSIRKRVFFFFETIWNKFILIKLPAIVSKKTNCIIKCWKYIHSDSKKKAKINLS